MVVPLNKISERPDGQLLSEVASGAADEEAFQELVRRHGAMVLAACNRMLGGNADADDAAQAVFLILWKKAASLGKPTSVATWLHRVARNVCRNTARERKVRSHREREVAEMQQHPQCDDQWDTIKSILDDELDQLPEGYRRPLILFHLEGRPLREVAALMDLNSSTVGTRLTRAREMLRSRLTRRGITISTTVFAATLTSKLVVAATPVAFISSTTQTAVLFATAHNAAECAVAAPAISLAKGALQAMFALKVKFVSIVALASAVTVFGSFGFLSLASGTSEDQKSVLEQSSELSEQWQSLDEEQAGEITARNLKAIMWAIHVYGEEHDYQLPPAFVANASLPLEKRLSGMVHLLPYLGRRPSYVPESDQTWTKWAEEFEAQNKMAKELFAKINQGKAWDDPVNSAAAKTFVPFFVTPSGAAFTDRNGYAVTHFAFVRGSDKSGAHADDGPFPVNGVTQQGFEDISDGTIDTLGVGQVHQQLGPWIAAGPSTARRVIHPSTRSPEPTFGSQYDNCSYCATCDAATFVLDMGRTDKQVLAYLATRAGGERSTSSDYFRYSSVSAWRKSLE